MQFLGIAGSLRRESFNRALLRAAGDLLPDGVTLEPFDIAGMPLFNQDDEQHPSEIVTNLKRKIRESDAVVLATPEYNYSTSGVLKNAIDWASRPHGDSAWNGKPVAIMGASVGSVGTARAQYHLRQMFVFLNMHPVNQPEVMVANAPQKFDANGNLTDETSRRLIRQLLLNLAQWTKQINPVQKRERELVHHD